MITCKSGAGSKSCHYWFAHACVRVLMWARGTSPHAQKLPGGLPPTTAATSLPDPVQTTTDVNDKNFLYQ